MALEGVSGQQHAPAAPYSWERPGTHFTGGYIYIYIYIYIHTHTYTHTHRTSVQFAFSVTRSACLHFHHPWIFSAKNEPPNTSGVSDTTWNICWLLLVSLLTSPITGTCFVFIDLTVLAVGGLRTIWGTVLGFAWQNKGKLVMTSVTAVLFPDQDLIPYFTKTKQKLAEYLGK